MQNSALATQLYSKAADNGIMAAILNLAAIYWTGRAVPRDCAHAAIWYRKAVDRGNVQSQERMVFIYREGKVVAADKVEAEKWLARSHGSHP